MSDAFEQVLKAAKTLPDHDRIQLVDALLETLPTDEGLPFHRAWLGEIARRSEEIDSGAVNPVPWEDVKRRRLINDDSLTDELLATSPRFRALVEKSKASPRKPFSAAE